MLPPTIQIGADPASAVRISPLVLAPMSGVTCSAFRRLIKELNRLPDGTNPVGLVVTEFISVEALSRRNEQSIRMMGFREEERPFSVQIFGHDVERMVEAARMAQDAGADIVDINSGCPVPKVVKKGGGCELMRQPDHVAKVLTRLRAALRVPLTLKIRAGWDVHSRNAVEIARIAEDAGVDMLAVHGRTRTEMYRGLADWDLVGEVVRAIRIPVIGSGDVVDAATARERLGSGVAGLMIGRAALANPWVFREIAHGIAGSSVEKAPAADTVTALERYTELLLEDLPERGALGRLKQFASQVTRRVHGSSPFRKALCASHSLAEFLDQARLLREFIANPPQNYRFGGDFLAEYSESSGTSDQYASGS